MFRQGILGYPAARRGGIRGRDNLGSAAVRDADPQRKRLILSRFLFNLVHRLSQCVRESFALSDETHTDSLLPQCSHLFLYRLMEEVHEKRHLFFFAIPILG